MLKTKSGITKVYFSELPKDVQEQFHYDPAQAAAAQAAAVQQAQQINQFNKQAEELGKQQDAASKEKAASGSQLNAKYNNTQALADRLAVLQQQEQNLCVQSGKRRKQKPMHGGDGFHKEVYRYQTQQKRSYPFFAVTWKTCAKRSTK